MQRPLNEISAKEMYLREGKVPFKYAVSKGIISLFRDPILLFILYLPGPIGLKLRQLWYKSKVAFMGKGVVVEPNVHIPTLENLHLADFCYLGWGLQIYAPEGFVKIGKRCHITGRILGHGGVEIGDYVGCGGTLLSITDSHQGGSRMCGPMVPNEQRNLKLGKIIIQKDAFIGQHSIVMPGVTVGEGAVVAPFSLVVRNVRPWTVVSGVPAVKISDRERVRFPDPD